MLKNVSTRLDNITESVVHLVQTTLVSSYWFMKSVKTTNFAYAWCGKYIFSLIIDAARDPRQSADPSA